MGILKNLGAFLSGNNFPNGNIPPVTPPGSSYTAPQENYDSYSNLPNPGPNLQGDYKPNPYRVHGPFSALKNWWFRQNQADPTLERTPDVELYTYMKTGVELPYIPEYQPAHGVQVPDPNALFNVGWKQQEVPQDARRDTILNAASPAPLLSQPIRVKTFESSTVGKRQPLKARAPKPVKGVQQ
jgi:hypothetical protein